MAVTVARPREAGGTVIVTGATAVLNIPSHLTREAVLADLNGGAIKLLCESTNGRGGVPNECGGHGTHLVSGSGVSDIITYVTALPAGSGIV